MAKKQHSSEPRRSSALAGSVPRVLDARTLGRPVHLLPAFAASLGENLSALLQNKLNRRYRASFALGDVAIRHADHAAQHPAAPPQWQVFGSESGRIAVALDRSILLTIFGYRYGLRDAQGTDEVPAASHTITEERLATSLALQFARTLADSIERCGAPQAASLVPTAHHFELLPSTTLWSDAWSFHASISETTQNAEGRLWLAFDDAWMARLLQKLAPQGQARMRRPRGKEQPLLHALQLTLLARLLKKDMPLGSLLDLRVGDVIPVSLGPTDVLIDDSRLFTAVVAEHKGKLCLTSFEDAE